MIKKFSAYGLKYIVLTSFLFLVTVSVVLNLSILTPTEGSNQVSRGLLLESFTGEHKKWAQEIAQFGAEQAYSNFKKTYQDTNPASQHAAAHIFGQVLYVKVGLSGATICDESFAFGCFHSFLANAIQAEGMGVIKNLNEQCIAKLKSQALGCQHGIGHGILASTGYEFANLANALEICDSLPANDPIGGCLGGVFMEYNLQTTLGVKGRTRLVENNDYFYPCRSVAGKYGPACFYWQAQWWRSVLQEDSEQQYTTMGKFCDQVTKTDEREQCFVGIGNEVGSASGWEVEKARTLCDLLTNTEGAVLCRSGGAGVFYAEPTVRKVALELCEGLESAQRQVCIGRSSVPEGATRE